MNVVTELLSPSFVLSTLLALLWATLWFVWRGGGWRGWVIDALAALLGSGVGQLVGELLHSPLPTVGEARLIEATLGSWLALWLVYRLQKLN